MKKLFSKLLKWRAPAPGKPTAKGATTSAHEVAMRHAETWRRRSPESEAPDSLVRRARMPATGPEESKTRDAADRPAGRQTPMRHEGAAEKPRTGKAQKADDKELSKARQRRKKRGDTANPEQRPVAERELRVGRQEKKMPRVRKERRAAATNDPAPVNTSKDTKAAGRRKRIKKGGLHNF